MHAVMEDQNVFALLDSVGNGLVTQEGIPGLITGMFYSSVVYFGHKSAGHWRG